MRSSQTETPPAIGAAAPPEAPGRRAGSGGVTWRSALIGLLLVPIHSYWITTFEVRWYSLDSTSLPLMITPIFLLFCVVLLNLPLVRWAPRRALDQAEMLTIYIVLVISGVFSAHDMIQNLFGVLGHARWFARPENNWESLFFRYIPWWLFVNNKNALTGFYHGESSPWEHGNWLAWVSPLVWWGLFMMGLVVTFLSANVLLRKQWTRSERLTFPLVQLPVALTGQGEGLNLLTNSMTWLGFGLAFTIGLVNGLATLYPSFPYIAQVKQYNITASFTDRPWSAIRGTNISMYPFAIGIAYFVPLDLSFSIWFFFIVRKLWQVLGSMAGWDARGNSGFPFFGEQASGAFLTFALILVVGLRKPVARAWAIAWGKSPGDDPEEPRLFRFAFLGLLGGIAFTLGFGIAAGLSPWVAVAFFAVYFLISVAITRVRAELGAPHEIYFVNPQQILVNVFGTSVLGPANLTVISAMYWLHRGYRPHPMPAQLESFKMADVGGIRWGRLVALTVVASLVSILAAYWANLTITYSAGAAAKCQGFKSWVGAESFDRLASWLNGGQTRQPARQLAMVAGAAIVMALSLFRGKFIWWPFHPAGYALAFSFAADYFWFCFLIAWAAKSLLIRYGGMRMHNAFIPFFLGLILGDYTIGSIWAIIGPLIGTVTYKIYI